MFGLLLSRHAGVMFSSTNALVFAALQGSSDTRQVASVTVPPLRPECQYNPQPTAQVMKTSLIMHDGMYACIGAFCEICCTPAFCSAQAPLCRWGTVNSSLF